MEGRILEREGRSLRSGRIDIDIDSRKGGAGFRGWTSYVGFGSKRPPAY